MWFRVLELRKNEEGGGGVGGCGGGQVHGLLHTSMLPKWLTDTFHSTFF